MNVLLLISVMLIADPGTDEQKLIQDAKSELSAARTKAGGPVGVNAAAVTPHMDLLSLKVGSCGALSLVDDRWTARIVENKPDGDNGVELSLEVRPKAGDARSIRLYVAGAATISDQLKYGCVVTGVKNAGNEKTYQLSVVERYDAFGALIK